MADYGQLELRLLAHMAGCQSMLEAFRLGGDFHSRTALGMYDHIQAAIDQGAPPVPRSAVDYALLMHAAGRLSSERGTLRSPAALGMHRYTELSLTEIHRNFFGTLHHALQAHVRICGFLSYTTHCRRPLGETILLALPSKSAHTVGVLRCI